MRPLSSPLTRFVLRRLVLTAVTLLGLATLVFLMVKLTPGDEAQMAAGEDASPAQIALVRARLGLDAPLWLQYLRFLARLADGDLGTSITSHQPVVAGLAKVLPSTIELVVAAMILNLAVALPLGTLAAARRGGWFDGTVRVVAVVAGGLPTFWLALMAQYLLGGVWRIVPISGHHAFGKAAPVVTGMRTLDALIAGNLVSFRDALAHLVVPAAVLAVLFATQIFRTLRASLLGVLDSDFIAPVRAKGASAARVLLRHALPNAIAPVMTLGGTQLGVMLGTAVLVETVFARQGVGSYLTNAVTQKDSAAVLGAVLFVGAVICVVSMLVDVVQILLDPRVRAAQLAGGR
jgi:peptide/nickel transport system permease protein